MALTEEQENYYSQAKRRVDQTYNLGLAQTNYQQDVASGVYGRNKGNLFKQYARMRERLPGSYARRGLMNSGVWLKGLTDFQSDKNRAISDLANAYNEQITGFNLGRQQLGSVREEALKDLETQRQLRMAALAGALTSVR